MHPRALTTYFIIAALFLGSLTMMNILGISRFIDLSFSFSCVSVPMLVPIGVLVYPVTFLCTDLVSELFGKKAANRLVFAGLIANFWMLFIIWLAGVLPQVPPLSLDTGLPVTQHPEFSFYQIRAYALGGILASMISYAVAQFLDVHLFHYFAKKTKGRHLWLRNNASTLLSQAVDTALVLTCTWFIVGGFPIAEQNTLKALTLIFISSYLFKVIAAVIDTIPLYILVRFLRPIVEKKD